MEPKFKTTTWEDWSKYWIRVEAQHAINTLMSPEALSVMQVKNLNLDKFIISENIYLN